MSPHAQQGFAVRFGWGLVEALALTTTDEPQVVVVVDVLSFTTCVTVAADLDIAVWPYPWRDETAVEFARERKAVLAGPRGDAVSLSPSTLREASGLERLVLPSPNGATICHALAARGVRVVAASLRNAGAVATYLADHVFSEDAPVTVIAAGERWPDGSLRPAVEDLWGAGAVLAGLPGLASPEARAATAAFRDVGDELPQLLAETASGRELTAKGYADDVRVAAERDSSSRVPVLRDGAFTTA